MRQAGQSTSMMLLVFVILIIVGVLVFLVSLTDTVSTQEGYVNLYTNNLLLATLRTDTGINDTDCQRVSDLLGCAYLTPEKVCRGETRQCVDLANETVAQYLAEFELVRKNYRYLFTIKGVGFIPGSPVRLRIGDGALDCDLRDPTCERIEKIVAREVIHRPSAVGSGYSMDVELTIARK